MSQVDDEDPKSKDNWTENDLKEAIRRINAGEINFKEAENVYGISPRTIHRQRAIENMRAQLNPEKAKKMKSSNNSAPKKDVTILRKPLDLSCTNLTEVVSLLSTATEEVKQLLNYECDLIYECKVCKNLFRSLANFISHKRIYCCDLYSVAHTRTDENDDESELTVDERLKERDNIREFSAKPFRVTCRKDLTTVLKRIKTMSDLLPSEPILHLQTIENTPSAFQQVLFKNGADVDMPFNPVEAVDIAEPKELNQVVPTPVSIVQVEPKPPPVEKPQKPVPVEKAQKPTPVEKPLKPAPVEKPQEKPSTTTTEKPFIAEKRFRCPICLANFTLKRSTLRHLKSVHHKSVEQVEKLKTRIQVHFVRIKSNSNDPSNKDKQDDPNHPKEPSWSKECLSCHRIYVNKPVYMTHLKSCRRNTSRLSSDTNSETSPTKNVSPLLPVVSLTPIATGSLSPKSETDTENTAEAPQLEPEPVPAPAKKASSSKKVSVPVTASSSSKKIGIQVRMNYCKDAPSAPNSATVTPTSQATTSSMSDDNSRRNSVLSIIGCSEDLPVKAAESSKVCHNTRSGAKLFQILESLYDKKNKTAEKTAPASETVENKQDKVTIYCNSCRKIFPINEFNCDVSQDNGRRYFKCALRNCDFQSGHINRLVPHFEATHSSMGDQELAAVKSIFIAVFCDQQGLDSLADCKRRAIFYEKAPSNNVEDIKAKKKPNLVVVDKPTSNEIAPVVEATSNTSSSSTNKRKLPLNTLKQNPIKRKQIDKESPKIDLKNIEDIPIKPEVKEDSANKVIQRKPEVKEDSANKVIQRKPEVKEDGTNKVIQRASVENARTENTHITVKRIKKIKKDIQTSPARPKSIKIESKVLNGDIGASSVSSSEDEGNDKCQTVSTIKPNNNKNIRTQNITAIDQKLWNSPQRMNLNIFHNDLSPSSSTPDSDLDQSAMSDENLRKSIMTIIFGKDMTAEKVEQSISTRDKSPSSSSSSECDKEKRYSFRIAKKGPQKMPVSVENKEDKTLKLSCLNKGKPTSR